MYAQGLERGLEMLLPYPEFVGVRHLMFPKKTPADWVLRDDFKAGIEVLTHHNKTIDFGLT